MPWTGKTFSERHNRKLSGATASKAASQANAMLRAGVSEGIAIATANKHAARGLEHAPGKKFSEGGPVARKMTSADIDRGRVPASGTGVIRNERTGKVTPIGDDRPMGGATDKDRVDAVKKFAKGGPVQPHLRMSPNHKNTPMPISAMAGPMMPTHIPETNIYGIPIHRPMNMNMSRR